MSLIKCHECGSNISTVARRCPSCGALSKTRFNRMTTIAAIVIAGLRDCGIARMVFT
ncbi:zinc-ribbon domain-containing protein [Paraburkholderia silviterrae]|uniref:zinc-ribbon domain-containing protein n=1 Tax=Paraburkholderia silviterrae TaxID=2528715 RepID=UPI0036373F88